MLDCPKCGKKNPAGSKFCSSCGERLDEHKYNNSERLLSMLTVLTSVLLVVLLVLSAVYFTNPGPTQGKAQEKTRQMTPFAVPDSYYVRNRHTYAFYDSKYYDLLSYQDMKRFCRVQGGHLAVINDEKENQYLYELIRKHCQKTVYFGYSDEEKKGNWKWDGDAGDYENWPAEEEMSDTGSGAQPDSEEDYAVFRYSSESGGFPGQGTWSKAAFPKDSVLFICEWDYDVTVQ